MGYYLSEIGILGYPFGIWDIGILTFNLELIKLGYWDIRPLNLGYRDIGPLKLGYLGYQDPPLHTPNIGGIPGANLSLSKFLTFLLNVSLKTSLTEFMHTCKHFRCL